MMDEFKTCTHCFNPLPIKPNFPEGKPKMDGTKTYLSWRCTCKYEYLLVYEYNLEYMRKRRLLIHSYMHTYYIRTCIHTYICIIRVQSFYEAKFQLDEMYEVFYSVRT